MEHFIFQLGCLVIVLYIALSFWSGNKRLKQKIRGHWFERILAVATISIIFDGFSAYTVNHLEEVPAALNIFAHVGYHIGLDTIIFTIFLYMLHITDAYPKHWWSKTIMYGPFVANVAVVVIFIKELQYYTDTISNYAMGISAYTCFITAGIYMIYTICKFVEGWKYIEKKKRASIGLYLGAMGIITFIKMIEPQLLITAIGPLIFVLGIYNNQENPVLKELENYQVEMIMGFATLVENRDNCTGGHVRRTSMYVDLLANALRRKGYYKDILTMDYIQDMIMAAPLHDIGKIAVPDVILQKPEELTPEEYELMKQHTVSGGQIVLDTFGHLEDEQYKNVAYQVARYHHEKWNGKGYPEGLKMEEIPLCARIVAIADVFDAVSEQRCYQTALTMDESFRIIKEGSGSSFEPVLVDIFMELRPQVEAIHDYIHNSMEDS